MWPADVKSDIQNKTAKECLRKQILTEAYSCPSKCQTREMMSSCSFDIFS